MDAAAEVGALDPLVGGQISGESFQHDPAALVRFSFSLESVSRLDGITSCLRVTPGASQGEPEGRSGQ